MKTGKKLLTGTLLALCAALLVLCIVLAAGWSKAVKTNAALPEVRNNGTAIQWKYSDETDWRDLVALTELRGAAGEAGKNGTDGKDGSNGADGKNGIDGKDGADGKDGINAKNIEVQRAETHIPVSYTHLDVYKRQGDGHEVCIGVYNSDEEDTTHYGPYVAERK